MSLLRLTKALKSFQTPSHARSPVQERELAGKLGGRRVSGSGCGLEKGDVRVKGIVRVEAKTTKADSFSVTKEMIKKIESAALTSGEVPVIVVEFSGDKSMPSLGIMPMWAIELMVGERSHAVT